MKAEIWLAGEHYMFDREQWDELTTRVEGSVHDLPDAELEALLENVGSIA